MCRFVAYRGKNPIILKRLLSELPNSLISQSRLSREMKTGLNGDGFGVGWYDRKIDDEPGVYRSIQPAWNDANLISISSKVHSDCFVGHVRASTVGDVSLGNCHPFVFKQFLFAHNGTIHNFEKIKKNLIILLEDEYFAKLKGQTDSEHFFILVCNIIEKEFGHVDCNTMAAGIMRGIEIINNLLNEQNLQQDYRINAVLTNGNEMVAIRYTSDKKKPLSLYYTKARNGSDESVIIASECLTDVRDEWEEIPLNTILTINESMKINIQNVSNFAKQEGYK
jgi:glutamine amidotransferase